MKVIFQDSEIVVCIKPEGLLSQTDNNGKDNAVDRLKEICGCEIYPVHRLDKTTMGLMVFAKTKQSAAALSAAIASGELAKIYTALVHNKPLEKEGEMRDLLFFDRSKNKSFVANKKRAGVKEAILNYKVSQYFEDSCELSINLKTGRTHQIRVQCASRGMALLGDHRYGARDEYKKIALCARELKFCHPTTQRVMEFSITSSEEYIVWRRYFSCI